jgi:hypothetical protein
MKLVALFLSFAFLAGTTLYSQQYDDVDAEKVFINQMPIGTKKSIVIKKLGKPVRITKAESMTFYWFDYHYKNSEIQIDVEGDLFGFNILDSSFVLTCNTTNIKIGDSISVLGKVFQRSYKTYKTEKSRYFRVRFKDADAYILFSIQNNRIARFESWEDDT